MTGLLSAWVAELVLITYRTAKQGTTVDNPIPHLALPSEYASTFIIYGALAFIPGEAQKVATAIGWGLVVATFLNLWDPSGKVHGAVAPSEPVNNAPGNTGPTAGAGPSGAGGVVVNQGTASTPGYPVKAA